MIKNQLYPYIEKYINELLYGFSKEQFDVGVMNGQIKLEKLNLRPDGANKILDDKNFSFWLKAGFISKIFIGCSIMNFIGEKPLDVLIEGVDIILTPSYKWIIKNLDSFIIENNKQIKEPYDPNDNNSMDIFERKVNVLDNSIFKKEEILEIFKDTTKISHLINILFKYCFKFYYMKNFLVNAKIKNIHIRFEDDQIINYTGDIALGLKADSLDITLSSEGVMKKDSFKINNLNIYWEDKAKILIPSDLLHNSIINGELNEKYYDNLKKINFQNFNYSKGTKFIVQNFNCTTKMGTISISSGKIDLFGKRDNSFKMYTQFSCSELNINIFPELFNIYTNYKKFIHEFSVLEQVQDFKPMRKPYDKRNAAFKEMLKRIQENKSSPFSKIFPYKRKMIVRDWLFYFYWCQKCKTSIYEKTVNPLRLEFSRFYGICFNQWEDLSPEELKKMKEKKDNEEKDGGLNPDNVVLFLIGDFLIKGVNINLHSSIKESITEYISFNIGNIDIKLTSSKNQFDLNTNVKNINIFPNKVIIGEKFIFNTNFKKREQTLIDNNKNNEPKRYIPICDIDENTGLVGLVKKYNPNYDQKIKIIDNALDKIGGTKSRADSRAMSEVDFKEFAPKYQFKSNVTNNNHKNDDTSSNFYKNDRQRSPFSLITNNNSNNNYNFNNHQIPKNYSFAKQIISNYEGTPIMQKMELKKQKNEFSISQAINEYNSRKSRERTSLKSFKNPSSQITNVIFSKNERDSNISSTQIISTGKNVPLNLLEISSNNSKSFIFKYTKNNNNNLIDHLLIQSGIIRLNLFVDYISTYLNILSEYKKVIRQPIINTIQKIDNGIKIQKELFNVKKYIYNYVIKIPEKKKNQQIKEYLVYLKNEIDRANKLGAETDNFEINYLISFFPKGFDINFDYENIEIVYYNNDKKVIGKAVIPPPEFQIRIDPNIFKIRFFDFEFEINDLENSKFFIGKTMNILEEKLKMTKLFIEPCLAQLREDLNKKNKEKKNELETIEKIKKKKLDNMLSLVQENLNNKKDIREGKEIGKIDNKLINYENRFNINNNFMNNKDINKINKEYKEQRANVPTLRENEDDEINDIDNDELSLSNKINVRQTKKLNNFFQNISENNNKINNIKMNLDIDSDSIDKFNNIENMVYQNNIPSPIKNTKKNNLPKVNKK